MVLAFPLRVLQTFVNNAFHSRLPFVCALSGSHAGNQNDFRSCQTLGAPRPGGKAGGFLDDYEATPIRRGFHGHPEFLSRCILRIESYFRSAQRH